MNWLKENWFYLTVLVIALAIPQMITNLYYAQIITMSCIFAIGALSMNLIMGYTGQMSSGAWRFFCNRCIQHGNPLPPLWAEFLVGGIACFCP